MKRSSLVILLGSLLATTVAVATTYVRVEKDGTKTYSDRPIPGGTPIELEPAQTYSAPSSSASSATGTPEQRALAQAADFRYSGCALTPRYDETFHSPERVTVALELTPRLRPGDRVTLTLDGSPLGEGGTSATIEMPDRGAHTVNAQVVEPSGRAVCQASTVFHVMRPTLNSPARNPPPRTPPPRPRPR